MKINDRKMYLFTGACFISMLIFIFITAKGQVQRMTIQMTVIQIVIFDRNGQSILTSGRFNPINEIIIRPVDSRPG